MNLYTQFLQVMALPDEDREKELVNLLLEAIAREKDYKLHQELMTNLTTRFISTNQALQTTLEEVKKLATEDFLTQLYNRSYFSKVAEYELAKHMRSESNMCLILFDIDHFKHINDSFGHDIGDIALIEISKAINQRLRVTDTFARWGGEEFIILLPNTTLEHALILAEDLRITVENLDIALIPIRITCSFGVVTYQLHDNQESLIKRADRSLYQSKQTGRNKVSSLDRGAV